MHFKIIKKMADMKNEYNKWSNKTKFYEATNNFKEHKYFKQNPRLLKFAFNLLWNGFI